MKTSWCLMFVELLSFEVGCQVTIQILSIFLAVNLRMLRAVDSSLVVVFALYYSLTSYQTKGSPNTLTPCSLCQPILDLLPFLRVFDIVPNIFLRSLSSHHLLSFRVVFQEPY